MTIKDKLQITIITYNRAKYLKRSLSNFTNTNSPIRDYSILILDNNSSDNTKDIVREFQRNYINISYIKNKKNVGANANIAKAFEYNQKDYLWVVADDDVYDWSNWAELEQAIENNEKVIVISRMDLPDKYKNNIGKILHQCAFVSGFISHKSLIDDTAMRNMYDNVYCMFPHLIPLVTYVNDGGNFYVLNNGVIKHGSYENKSSEDVKKEDVFARGAKLEGLWRKSRTMQFDVGFAIALSNLNDENLKHNAIKLQMETQLWQTGLRQQKNVLMYFINFYKNQKDLTQLIDIYLNVDKENAEYMSKYIIHQFELKSILNGLIYKINVSVNELKKEIMQTLCSFKYKTKYYIYSFAKVVTFGKLHKKMSEKYEKYRRRIK